MTDTVTLAVKILRSPDAEHEQPHFEEYTVEVSKGARVLNVLTAVRETIDSTLDFRYCCRSGQCGSCAVKINSVPKPACTTEAEDGMVIEPLDLPVIKDLRTDISGYLKTMPGFVPKHEDEDCHASCIAGLLPDRKTTEELKPLRDCIECLCCVSACPVIKAAKYAGPTYMRQMQRLALDPRTEQPDIKQVVTTDSLFNCTTCQACFKVCPKSIKIPGKAVEKLRILAAREGLTLPRHKEVQELIKTTGRSVTANGRTLLDEIDEIREPDGKVKAEVGFFTGCLYNMRLTDVAKDALEILRINGIRVITPKEQVCCGSPLIRTGQTDIVPELMKKNIECFTKRGIKTVMTVCAGCGSTLKNDYDCPFEILDINEILMKYGIKAPAKLDIKVAYHDPCHLLRGQGIRDEPRELLKMVCRELVEIPSVCCGSGGGVKSGCPETAEALGKDRAAEIAESGCDIAATSCPFCELHLRSVTDVPVKNINTLLLEGYRKENKS